MKAYQVGAFYTTMATLYIHWKDGIEQQLPNTCNYFAKKVVKELEKATGKNRFTYEIK